MPIELLLLPLKSRSGACGFSACKRRLPLLEEMEATSEGGTDGLHEVMREEVILLLPLKLPEFGREL